MLATGIESNQVCRNQITEKNLFNVKKWIEVNKENIRFWR
jgi:hypothetical protein